MTMIPGITPGGWQVGTQVVSYTTQTTGRPIKGWTVHFVTAYGVSGDVFVRDATYQPNRVKQIIAAKVKALDEVSASTGLSK